MVIISPVSRAHVVCCMHINMQYFFRILTTQRMSKQITNWRVQLGKATTAFHDDGGGVKKSSTTSNMLNSLLMESVGLLSPATASHVMYKSLLCPMGSGGRGGGGGGDAAAAFSLLATWASNWICRIVASPFPCSVENASSENKKRAISESERTYFPYFSIVSASSNADSSSANSFRMYPIMLLREPVQAAWLNRPRSIEF